jgi:hypothetical protein
MSSSMKVHERTTEHGLEAVILQVEDGVLAITSDVGTLPLPDGAIDAVMSRYGSALDPSARLVPIASLDLGHGRSLRHVRHLATWDVIARDYLVYEHASAEALCALATTVAGALDHLGRAARSRGDDDG